MSGHIGVVGAGLVGSGWAIVFARAGYQVRIFDESESIRERLPTQLRGIPRTDGGIRACR